MNDLNRIPACLSQRLERFRGEILNVIPRFPNDRAGKQHMEEMHLGDVLIDFVNWRARFVGVRPRKVQISEDATNDPRWITHKGEIEAFLDKVVRGDDLSPHLSRKTRSRGVRAVPREDGATVEEAWSDKDFVLTTMGFHHFHLSSVGGTKGQRDRSNLLLFAQVSRDEFLVVGLFDHSVFRPESRERIRLYGIDEYWSMKNVALGSVVIKNPIMTSAHSMHHVYYARRCLHFLREIDPQLDDPGFVQSLFDDAGVISPGRPNFEWCFHHLDLGVQELTKRVYFSLQKGWN